MLLLLTLFVLLLALAWQMLASDSADVAAAARGAGDRFGCANGGDERAETVDALRRLARDRARDSRLLLAALDCAADLDDADDAESDDVRRSIELALASDRWLLRNVVPLAPHLLFDSFASSDDGLLGDASDEALDAALSDVVAQLVTINTRTLSSVSSTSSLPRLALIVTLSDDDALAFGAATALERAAERQHLRLDIVRRDVVAATLSTSDAIRAVCARVDGASSLLVVDVRLALRASLHDVAVAVALAHCANDRATPLSTSTDDVVIVDADAVVEDRSGAALGTVSL